MEITENELLEALAEAETVGRVPENALTSKEISETTGMSRDAVLKKLGKGVEDGSIGVVSVKVPRIDGIMNTVPAFYKV